MEEIWKDVKGCEGKYKVSNLGNVKSLARSWTVGGGAILSKPETILKQALTTTGYWKVTLSINGKLHNSKVHLLVWDTFGNAPRDGQRLLVDHKDENKLNNRVDNLQLLSLRDNTSKSYSIKQKTSSHFTGVCYNKKMRKWQSCITVNGNSLFLGYYNRESQAGIIYMLAKNILPQSNATKEGAKRFRELIQSRW